MLACLSLVVFVSFPPAYPAGPVHHEWHHHTFCERGIDMWDKPRIDNPDFMPGECELAANQYLLLLQMAGVLPGSRDVIQYQATCTTTI